MSRTKSGQRIMIYDATTIRDGVDWKEDGLAYSWFAGGKLYRIFRWLDKTKGVESWEEALDYLIEQGKKEPISQVQYWGHGFWGSAWIGSQRVDSKILAEGKPLRKKFEELSELLTEDALWWWRTCQTYGTEYGQQFAKDFTELLNCKTAAHTYIIGPWQSGGHSLVPGEEPDWSPEEGVESRPERGWPKAKWSGWREPNTIFCLQGHLPKDW